MTKTEKLIVKEFKRIVAETPLSDWELSEYMGYRLYKKSEPQIYIEDICSRYFLGVAGHNYIKIGYFTAVPFLRFLNKFRKTEQDIRNKEIAEAEERYNLELLEKLKN